MILFLKLPCRLILIYILTIINNKLLYLILIYVFLIILILLKTIQYITIYYSKLLFPLYTSISIYKLVSIYTNKSHFLIIYHNYFKLV